MSKPEKCSTHHLARSSLPIDILRQQMQQRIQPDVNLRRAALTLSDRAFSNDRRALSAYVSRSAGYSGMDAAVQDVLLGYTF